MEPVEEAHRRPACGAPAPSGRLRSRTSRSAGLRRKKPMATWTGLGGVAPGLEVDFSDHAASKRRRTQATGGETGLSLPGGGCEVGKGSAPHPLGLTTRPGTRWKTQTCTCSEVAGRRAPRALRAGPGLGRAAVPGPAAQKTHLSASGASGLMGTLPWCRLR